MKTLLHVVNCQIPPPPPSLELAFDSLDGLSSTIIPKPSPVPAQALPTHLQKAEPRGTLPTYQNLIFRWSGYRKYSQVQTNSRKPHRVPAQVLTAYKICIYRRAANKVAPNLED